MKPFKQHQKNNLAVIVTGLVLFVAIYFTTSRLFATYANIENNRAESFWSIVQLQKELDAMYYHAELYRATALDHDTLQLRYELLWSRFPVVQNMLKKDVIFGQINGLARDIKLIFDNIKTVETNIIQQQMDKTQLTDWINTLATDRQRLNHYIVHNMSGIDDDYVANATKKLLAYLLTIAALILACILYLGFLIHILIQQQKRNRFLLDHDSLTGLKGRFYTLQAINKRCQQKQPFTLVNFDLNKFKQINDNYGHHTGDQVLLHIAGIFKSTIGQHSEVGRVGGDEFLWIIDNTDQDAINRLYDQLLTQLDRAFVTDSSEIIQLKISAGAGFAADHDFDENRLKDEVDKTMYCAKKLQMLNICWQNTLSENSNQTTSATPKAPQQTNTAGKTHAHPIMQIHPL